MYCKHCDTPNPDSATRCRGCGAVLTPKAVPAEYHPAPNTPAGPDFPMKWYYFLIYFLLFARAVIHVAIGILTFGLLAHAITPLPGIWGVAVPMALLQFAMAVLSLAARAALAEFRRRGPILLAVYWSCSIMLPLVQFFLAAWLCPALNSDFSFLFLPDALLLLLVNWSYFSKRKDCFIY